METIANSDSILHAVAELDFEKEYPQLSALELKKEDLLRILDEMALVIAEFATNEEEGRARDLPGRKEERKVIGGRGQAHASSLIQGLRQLVQAKKGSHEKVAEGQFNFQVNTENQFADGASLQEREQIAHENEIWAQVRDLKILVKDLYSMMAERSKINHTPYEDKRRSRLDEEKDQMVELRNMVLKVHEDIKADRISYQRYHEETLAAIRLGLTGADKGYILHKDLDEIREERRALREEIGLLFSLKSKYVPGGVFDRPEWKPTTLLPRTLALPPPPPDTDIILPVPVPPSNYVKSGWRSITRQALPDLDLERPQSLVPVDSKHESPSCSGSASSGGSRSDRESVTPPLVESAWLSLSPDLRTPSPLLWSPSPLYDENTPLRDTVNTRKQSTDSWSGWGNANVLDPLAFESGTPLPVKETMRPIEPASHHVVNDVEWQTIKDHAALRAICNSPERHDPPKCDPDTRLSIRSKMLDWLSGKIDTDSRILWLYGAAGTGKSALSQTFLETCRAEKLLLASFFFSRTDPTRNTINALVATLAYQIGATISGALETISEAVKKNSNVFIDPFETQLMDLVFKPLSHLTKTGSNCQLPRLIIIDGLHECFDLGVQAQVVRGFVDSLQMSPHNEFRVVISTRPEPHIEATFGSLLLTPLISRLPLELPVDQDDIRIFLENQFASVQKKHAWPSIPLPWPETAIVDELVERSRGQFVVASMIAKYISAESADPKAPLLRLDWILDVIRSIEAKGTPFAELDAIYLHILSSVPDVQTTVTKMILGIILFIDPGYDFFAPLATASMQTVSGIEYLLFLEPGKAKKHITALYPMVECTRDGHIFVPQATVAEFLEDPVRSKSFYIEKSAFLKTLLAFCFAIVGIHPEGEHDSVSFAYGRIPQLALKVPFTLDLERNLLFFPLLRCFHWCQTKAPQIGGRLTRAQLFPWWYITKFLVMLRQLGATAAYMRHLPTFEQLLLMTLSKYSSEDVILLLSLTRMSPASLSLSRDRVVNFLRRLLLNSTLDLDQSAMGLGLLSIYDGREHHDKDSFCVGHHWDQDIILDAYYQHLFDLVEHPTKAGNFFLCCHSYASAVFRCLLFASRILPDEHECTEEELDAHRLALLFVPPLFARASRSILLLKFLNSHEFALYYSSKATRSDEGQGVGVSIVQYLARFALDPRWGNSPGRPEYSAEQQLIMERVVPQAMYDSPYRCNPPRCFPETRVTARTQLLGWVTGTLDHIIAPMVSLHGAAGSGKSAVCQTFAETCGNMDLLLATFFFLKRDSNAISNLAPTIAYQVGMVMSETRSLILEAVEKNPGIFTEPFAQQIQELVFRPLSRITNHRCAIHFPRLIVVDGVDECLNLAEQSEILNGFAEALMLLPDYPIRVLITSCRTSHLEMTFNSRIPSFIQHHLALENGDGIGPYFKNWFADMRENHPMKSLIPPCWPTPSDVNKLVRHSGGIFAFASMLARYISANNTKPPDRLEALLRLMSSTNESDPFAGIYAFYRHVLLSIDLRNFKDPEMVKMILGVIIFFEPDCDSFAPFNAFKPSANQTIPEIAAILALEEGVVAAWLINLYPIIQTFHDSITGFPHITFVEFLQDCDPSDLFHLEKTMFLTSILRSFFQTCGTNKGGSLSLFYLGGTHAILAEDSVQSAYRYLPNICRKTPLTGELLNEAMNFSMSLCFSWCQNNSFQVGMRAEMVHLFPWCYVSNFLTILREMASLEVYMYQLSAFDTLVCANLSRYPSVEDIYLLMALASNRPELMPGLTQDNVKYMLHSLLVNSSTITCDESPGGLGILSICINPPPNSNVYSELLFEFFKDPVRSRQYCLSPNAYASAVFRCLQFLGCEPINNQQLEATRLVALFIPCLLERASKSKKMLQMINSNKFRSTLAMSTLEPGVLEHLNESFAKYQTNFLSEPILLISTLFSLLKLGMELGFEVSWILAIVLAHFVER